MRDDASMAGAMRIGSTVAVVLAAALLGAGCSRPDGGGTGAQPDVVAPGAGDISIGRGAGGSGGGAASADRGGGVVVDVAGAVRRPGVYRLAPGARVHEAIAAAGGASAGADLTPLNRAAPVVDGQQVLVPTRASSRTASTGVGASVGANGGGGTISLNTADASALDALPGIGPVTAQKIVADRTANGPFTSVDDLDRVPRIGAALIEQLRDLVTV